MFFFQTLILEPNSKLKFATSIGIVVHGLLTADGINLGSPVIMDVDDQEEFVPMENRTASVRLVDGRDEFEGRLEVEINGQWGTVCWDVSSLLFLVKYFLWAPSHKPPDKYPP